MNKKALVVGAIIGIIIAVILIFFVLKVGSEIFRLSTQAQDNFVELTQAVKDVNAQPTAPFLQRAFFYEDKKTYVYMIDKVSRDMHVTKDLISGDKVDFTLFAPPECMEINCLCLCRKYKDETDRSCLNLMCEPLPEVTFSPGTTKIVLDRGEEGLRRQEVKIYKCKGGESYCKNSKEGDISIIFSLLDSKGVYDSIK